MEVFMSNCDNCARKKAMEIISQYNGKPREVINCLQDIQDLFGYLPEEYIGEISKSVGVPESEIFGIITFYTRFRLTPKAKYNIDVCLGTACFINGADVLVNELEFQLGIKMGESTADGMYALTNTRCVGCCGLAPVITINGEVYGKVKRDDIKKILENLK